MPPGLKPGIVTGSGTGTHYIDAKLGVFTELQVGSYVFMDHDYNVCDLRGARQADLRAGAADRCARGERQHAGHGDGRCRPEGDGDREGPADDPEGRRRRRARRASWATSTCAVIAPEGKAAPAHGEQVILTPPHCDPTVNLYESYHVVKGDTLVDIWPVTARGRSR